jgi:ParB family transcriptional regulator, chromosome partitioning protein
MSGKSAKRKVDFGALAAKQVERDVATASSRPDRFEVARSVMAGPATLLEPEAITDRVRATRELDGKHVRTLAESIGAIGPIEPIVVDNKHRLLAGGHRLAAYRLLREERPEVYRQWFASGVPVYVKDFDSEVTPARALEVEVAENEHRRDYTPAQIKELVVRLREAGYRETVGRPKAGEKAIGPALEVIVGKSMKTIRKLVSADEAPADEPGDPSTPALRSLLRALERHGGAVPSALQEPLGLLRKAIALELELGGAPD